MGSLHDAVAAQRGNLCGRHAELGQYRIGIRAKRPRRRVDARAAMAITKRRGGHRERAVDARRRFESMKHLTMPYLLHGERFVQVARPRRGNSDFVAEFLPLLRRARCNDLAQSRGDP